MEVKLLQSGVYSVIFSKSFTLAEAPIFMALTMPLEKKDITNVLLDMGKLELIDSIGIKHLDNFKKLMENKGALVKAIHASSRICSICRYKKFDIHFDDS